MPIPLIQAPNLEVIQGLKHGFTTREGGLSTGTFSSLNLGWTTGDEDSVVNDNYVEIAKTLGVEKKQIVGVNQVHGSEVKRVDSAISSAELIREDADAMMTTNTGVLLSIRAADCLPILLVDSQRHAVAAVHAGWRGTLSGILRQTVAKMVKEFRTEPTDLIMAIGPGIGLCCFEVSFGIAALFEQDIELKPDEKKEKESSVYLDLAKMNQRLAIASGIRADRIWNSGQCTKCNAKRFFSYRRDGKKTGRQIGFIGWMS